MADECADLSPLLHLRHLKADCNYYKSIVLLHH